MGDNNTDIATDQSSQASGRLLMSISDIIREKGLKNTTMDSIAKTLGMSKRTLYEIFGSKQRMVMCVFDHVHSKMRSDYERMFAEAGNVMEALLSIFIHHRDTMRLVSVDFFRDMDELYPEVHSHYHKDQKEINVWMNNIYNKGVEEGVFRPDVDFIVTCLLLKVQMESLKRMEEFFPPELTLVQAFDNIIIGFLRTIASPEGMLILDETTNNLNLLHKIHPIV